jgi:hypothetical protein
MAAISATACEAWATTLQGNRKGCALPYMGMVSPQWAGSIRFGIIEKSLIKEIGYQLVACCSWM